MKRLKKLGLVLLCGVVNVIRLPIALLGVLCLLLDIKFITMQVALVKDMDDAGYTDAINWGLDKNMRACSSIIKYMRRLTIKVE